MDGDATIRRVGRIAARGDAREARVAGALLDEVEAAPEATLVVEDADGSVERALGGEAWSRLCHGDRVGRAWPPNGPFELVTVRLPKAREAFEMALHAVAARLDVGGRVLVYGGNDEGIRSAAAKMDRVFAQVADVAARRKCRVIEARDPRPGSRGALEDWRQAVDPPPGRAAWCSWPGLFARGGVDSGTARLLEALPPPPRGARVLDYGCGPGVIAATLLDADPALQVDALDADALALEAIRHNEPRARRLLGDAWRGVPEGRYDRIVSNPPYHRGKGEDFAALAALVDGAPDRLVSGGELWMVLPRQLNLQGRLDRFTSAEVAAEDSRYRVWRAVR